MTAGSLARFSLKTSGTFSLLSHRSNQRLASSRAQPASARHVGDQSLHLFLRWSPCASWRCLRLQASTVWQ